MTQAASHWGGSAEAIQHHYDVSNEFYALWLDRSMTYSCALWDESDDKDDLEAAQQRKLAHHARSARATPGSRILDIGCGWGSMIGYLRQHDLAEHCVGLTLSREQAEYVRAKRLLNVEIREESWTEHRPTALYDGIISVGAFEHFASEKHSSDEKLAIYRDFFGKCASWLRPNGQLSLQTICYSNFDPANASAFMQNEIFPESELPFVHEITAACKDTFEVVRLRNDRFDYMRTCDLWRKRLKRRQQQVEALVGNEVFARYDRYLKLSSAGFYLGKGGLLRIELRRFN